MSDTESAECSSGRGSRNGLRVGIAASGRFHLLDLARELEGLGADVKFYSYVSQRRALSFGLSRNSHVALLPFLFPLVAVERLLPRFLPNLVERLMCWCLDILVIFRMRRCDVFICMSGIYVLAARFAKWRFGAKVHLHRSSQHILRQREILEKVASAGQISDFMVRRELEGYDIADRIIVPSIHVAQSFDRWPDISRKLFLNSLGVDLQRFPLKAEEQAAREPTIIVVGQWSYRKGVDNLASAIGSIPNVRLIHVGALMDAPFPADPRFVHYDSVPQQQLPHFYAMADILALPSREDGFGVVLSQALASGLQVVCTDRTGGPDLVKLSGLARLVRIVPADDIVALREAILTAMQSLKWTPRISSEERQSLSWRGYAERDYQFMKACLA